MPNRPTVLVFLFVSPRMCCVDVMLKFSYLLSLGLSRQVNSEHL